MTAMIAAGLAAGLARAGEPSSTAEALLSEASEDARRGEWEEALRRCERAGDLEPNAMGPLLCRLHAQVALARPAEARGTILEIARLRPDLAVLAAAEVHTRFGDLRAVEDLAERCVEGLEPTDGMCATKLVWIHLIRGREKEAMARLREALDRAPSAAVRRHLLELPWNTIFLEHDRARLERLLGEPIPIREEAPMAAVRKHLPILRTPAGRARLRLERAQGWFVVRAKVDGRPLRLLVDTGSDHLSLRRSIAEELGLPRIGSVPILAEGAGPAASELALAKRLELGGVRLDRVPVSIEESRVAPGDGTLGVGLLQDFFVDLDFPRKRLRLVPARGDPREALPGLTKRSSPIPFVLEFGTIYVPGTIGEGLRGWFLFDTGGDIDFFEARHLPALARAGVRPVETPPGAPPPIAIGARGARVTGTYLSPFEARLGPLRVKHDRARAIPSHTEVGFWEFGAWGMETLRQARWVIDYRGRRLWVVSDEDEDPVPEPDLPQLVEFELSAEPR